MEIRPFQGSTWYRVELGPGADLFENLRGFLNKEALREAYIVYCIGSLDRVALAYPKTKTVPPEIERFTLEGLFEINVIAGEVRRQGNEIKVHLHGSVSREGSEVSGGAIIEGTRIFKVAEMVIVGVK